MQRDRGFWVLVVALLIVVAVLYFVKDSPDPPAPQPGGTAPSGDVKPAEREPHEEADPPPKRGFQEIVSRIRSHTMLGGNHA